MISAGREMKNKKNVPFSTCWLVLVEVVDAGINNVSPSATYQVTDPAPPAPYPVLWSVCCHVYDTLHNM